MGMKGWTSDKEFLHKTMGFWQNASNIQYFPLPLLPEKGYSFSDISHKAQQVPVVSGRQQGVTQNSYVMPKVKTNSSAKKRFKVTGTGKITHQKSFKRHILTKKSKKRKRNMRKDGEVAKSHMNFVKRLLRLK